MKPASDPPTPTPFWVRHLRREVQYALDLAVLLGAFFLAYLLRFDFRIPPEYVNRAIAQAPTVLLIQFLVIVSSGIYRFVWRYVGMAEVWVFARASLLAMLPALALRFGLPERFEALRIPLSIILLDAIFAFGGLLAIRILRRSIYERWERQRRARDRRDSVPVLLVGAGQAGVAVIREIIGRGDTGFEVVGFVDDDPRKQGTTIHGKRVLGGTDRLAELASELGVEHAIITIANANASTIRAIVKACEQAGLHTRIIPGLYEILEGKVSISRFRDVQIEDLLGRQPIELDDRQVGSLLRDRTVLVTGAGGSIGAELCRQVARYRPRRLLLLEQAEGALFEIHRELEQSFPELDQLPLVADITDRARMETIVRRWHPEVVFHAAAHKHVPMMEANPGEAVKNNVGGTLDLGQLSGECGIEAFVLISTDKAVRPSSIMGASKRVAELICQDLASRYPATRFVAVRFGNVMGSAGSVVPIFRRQIEAGGPVTVTHRDAVRYFMTIPEASQLVLQGAAIGGSGDVLILDMGRPIRILELAEDMITLSGYRPYDDVRIEFTGLRPGEKLSEELELTGERIAPTGHPKILVGRVQAPPVAFREALDALIAAGAAEDDAEIRARLAAILPEAAWAATAPALPERSDRRADEEVLN